MTATTVASIVLVLGICAMFAALIREERRKRQDAEDDLLIERLRVELLEDQVPFPFGERLP